MNGKTADFNTFVVLMTKINQEVARGQKSLKTDDEIAIETREGAEEKREIINLMLETYQKRAARLMELEKQ